jgi:hypothetical protein
MYNSPGRRPSPEPAHSEAGWKVRDAVYDYIADNAGSITGKDDRRTYTAQYRQFIVSLLDPDQPAQGMSIQELATYARIPLGTLKDWLRPQPQPAEVPAPEPQSEQTLPLQTDELVWVSTTRLQLIARLWKSWRGTFQAFCFMLHTQERIPCGNTFIGNFLQGIGLRHRRGRTPVEAPWSSGTFRTYFPGAQWLGDGAGIAFCWGEDTFVFNLEAIFDPAVGSVIGISVTDSEDEAAVRLAYQHAALTTGSPAMATSLDNRPSNHSPGTRHSIGALIGGLLQIPLQDGIRLAYQTALAAMGSPPLSLGGYSPASIIGTLLIRSTPGRGQAKAGMEGAFGLFQQALPGLVIADGSPREMARNALYLILTAWFRGRNGRPRKRLGNLSPAQAYHQSRPTQEEMDKARAAFHELLRREEQARQTRSARRDPVRLELLVKGLAELNIRDPEGSLARCLAYFAREAIVRGLAIFQAKQELGSLPPDADPGRYLGGIIKNHHDKLELEFISAYLLKQRIRLHDITLRPLTRAADDLRAEMAPSALPQAFVDRALAATWAVDFRFWTENAGQAIAALPSATRDWLYPSLGRRIAASKRTDRERRETLIDRLAESVAAAALS